MELRHLETFAMAAELQSFTRAAEALSVTQAAVSQHIAAIEKELRVSLFERTGRSVKPTAAGRRFYEYVRKVLDLLEQAKQDVAGTASVTRGTLRIAACAVAAELLLPEKLATFRPLYPQVQESLTVCDSGEATRAVVTATADLAVVAELPDGSDLRAQPIACDELLLVVPPGHHLAGSKSVRAKQLRKETFIVREPESGSQRCIQRALNDAGLPMTDLTVAMEINSHQAIRAAVEQGIGIAFLPRAIVQHELASGRLVAVPVDDVQPRRNLYLLTDPKRIPTAAVRAFLALMTQSAETNGFDTTDH